MTIENSVIAFSSDGEAVYCSGLGSAQLICCDVYRNEGNDWVGCIESQETLGGNFSADLIFCDPTLEVYRLDNDSPCLRWNNACGTQIGALGEGCTTAAAGSDESGLSVRFAQNRPNPFNPQTTLSFDLPTSGEVVLAAYDLTGRRVVTILDDAL